MSDTENDPQSAPKTRKRIRNPRDWKKNKEKVKRYVGCM